MSHAAEMFVRPSIAVGAGHAQSAGEKDHRTGDACADATGHGIEEPAGATAIPHFHDSTARGR
jgi:hypothetical protein